jgi:histidine triad (HIT) family protein
MPYSLPEAGDCQLCRSLEAADAVVIDASTHGVAIVADWMRTHGACVVAARRHAPTMFELSAAEMHDIFQLAQRINQRIVATIDPDGLHFWWDTGVLAGQELSHFFIEVVPRYADSEYKYAPLTDLPRRSADDLAAAERALTAPR